VAVPPGTGAVLLTTDVAARGVDIVDVDWVVQYRGGDSVYKGRRNEKKEWAFGA
jgi:ERCC4-related helicase